MGTDHTKRPPKGGLFESLEDYLRFAVLRFVVFFAAFLAVFFTAFFAVFLTAFFAVFFTAFFAVFFFAAIGIAMTMTDIFDPPTKIFLKKSFADVLRLIITRKIKK